jgi:Fe2+ or Zn2+ uptake regulation protein
MDLEQRIVDLLQQKDIRPSKPRTLIYKYLLEHRNHPTVDTIYKALQSDLTSLSRTTVYNTLNLMVEKGIVWALGIEDNELRYDADVSPHGHFKCLQCNAVFDFSFDVDTISISGLDNFTCQDYHLNVKGICKTCKNLGGYSS